MPRARCRRTVLRSSPTLRAMAETVSPCRFRSWIKTISPSVTTCAPPPFVGAEVGVETLAAALAESRDTLEEVIEPFLIQEGLILRTQRGRVLGLPGWKHLGMTPPRNALAAQGDLLDDPAA